MPISGSLVEMSTGSWDRSLTFDPEWSDARRFAHRADRTNQRAIRRTPLPPVGSVYDPEPCVETHVRPVIVTDTLAVSGRG